MLHGSVLRIHFSTEDLGRVWVARTPDPLWETVLSLRMLGQRRPGVLFEQWKQRTLGRLTPALRPLREFASSFAHCPDFLTPTSGGVSPERALSQVMSAPPSQVAAELSAAGATGFWAGALINGGRSALRQFVHALHGYSTIGITPYWPRILAAAERARARLARTMLDEGIERTLAGLWPDTVWRPPTLHMPYSGERDLVLNGRRLVLLPSLFSARAPIIRYDPSLPPVLVFSVRDDAGAETLRPGAAGRPTTNRKLAALLGRTRAAVLEATSSACTTSELARQVGISLASASQHATVLREAGLLSTVRRRNAVVHNTTPLGTALLTQQ